MKHTYFAMCARGLEPLLHQELKDLRLGKVERQVGGVRFEGSRADLVRANLWLRTAGRVLLRLGRFPAADGDALYARAKEIPWEQWLAPAGTLRVDAQSADSALDHTRFVEQRVKDAVCDRLREGSGERPSVAGEDADLRIHVHLWRDRATVSLDSSGAALRKRGWRQSQGEAPLAETLAAGLILASGWDRRSPLVDPFCGSGTLLVEAGLLAANRAPGLLRERFGFESWLDHDPRATAKLRAEAEAAAKPIKKLRLMGLDQNPPRLEDTAANLAAAGLADNGILERADARAFAPKPGWNGWVVSNLPYGRRVGAKTDLDALHRDFGAALAANAQGYHATLLTAAGPLADGLARALAAHRPRREPLANGGLECELLRVDL